MQNTVPTMPINMTPENNWLFSKPLVRERGYCSICFCQFCKAYYTIFHSFLTYLKIFSIYARFKHDLTCLFSLYVVTNLKRWGIG